MSWPIYFTKPPILEGIYLPRRDIYQFYRSKFFKPRLIIYFLSLLALIIHELGLETKETENQPRLKTFNLNLILTYNIIIHKLSKLFS